MAEKRRALADLAADRSRQGRGGRILKRALVMLVLLLLGSPIVLWACGFFTTPAAVAEVRRLVDEQVTEYERVTRGEVPFASAPNPGPLFEKMRGVPRQYREQAGREMGRVWQARERAEMGSYFALPSDQRLAELDRRIKAEEDRRRQWQEERERREQARAAGNQQAASDGDRGRDGRGQGGAPLGAPGGGQGGQPGGRGPAAGPRGSTSEEARNQRLKQRLDRTTPEERAQQAEYRRAMEARRAQLGLPSGGRRGG